MLYPQTGFSGFDCVCGSLEGILSSAHITDKMTSTHNSYARNAQMQSEKFAEFPGVFVDVARESSFSRAGRRLGRTPSSIGRQIDALEAYLDTPLFLRSTRHLTLTDAGEMLLIRARQILDSLEDTQQELASMKGEVTDVLRVACYPTFGKRYVLSVMAKLSRQYPAKALSSHGTELISPCGLAILTNNIALLQGFHFRHLRRLSDRRAK